jgi:hypothetical protein
MCDNGLIGMQESWGVFVHGRRMLNVKLGERVRLRNQQSLNKFSTSWRHLVQWNFLSFETNTLKIREIGFWLQPLWPISWNNTWYHSPEMVHRKRKAHIYWTTKEMEQVFENLNWQSFEMWHRGSVVDRHRRFG